MYYNNMDMKKVVDSIKFNVDMIKAEGYNDNFQIELQYLERYPDDYDKYPFLVKKIISGEGMDVLDKMLESLSKIENGSDKFKEEVELGKMLGEKYIKKKD